MPLRPELSGQCPCNRREIGPDYVLSNPAFFVRLPGTPKAGDIVPAGPESKR